MTRAPLAAAARPTRLLASRATVNSGENVCTGDPGRSGRSRQRVLAMTNCTLRLRCRPSSVVLGATGTEEP